MKKIDLNNIDELTKIALSDEKIVLSNDDIISFLNVFNITQGRFKIKSDVLYSIYKHWSKDPKTHIGFAKFLNRVLIGKRGYFYISLSALDIQQTLYEFLDKKSRSVLKVPKYKQHFDHFLNWLGFISGDFYIKQDCLYWLYDKWTYERKIKKVLADKELIKFSDIYFKHKRLKDGKYLGIDSTQMKTTIEQLQFATKWNEVRNEKKQKRKS